MKTGDPLVGILEDALSVPDFDLGDDLRRRLLAAAEADSPPQVIQLVTEESWDVSGFNWLLGERSSDPALMDRLVSNAAFADAVAGQMRFLRSLRSALNQTTHLAESVRRNPFNRVRAMQAASMGIAAAMAWLLVAVMPVGLWKGSSRLAEGSTSTGANPAQERAVSGDEEIGSGSTRQVTGFAEATHRSGETGKLTPRENLESVREGAGLLELDEATQLAARELFQGQNEAFSMAPIQAESGHEAVMASSAAQAGLASQSGSNGNWMFAPALLSMDRSSFPGLTGGAVPEPSGLLLMALGSLMLLSRRERPDQTI